MAIALAVVAIIAVRKHDSVANPQFWAEDGGLFFIEGEQNASWLLSESYKGYFHILPRIIAGLGRNLPLMAVPAFYAWTSLLITGTVAWGIQSPRVRLPGTMAAALAIALIPHNGEVYITICNLQWITAIGLFALAIAADPTTWFQRIADILFLAVLGLTGPFIVPALPLFAWRAWRRRSAWSVSLLALAAGCLGVQAGAMLAYRPDPHPEAWAPLHGAAVIGRRLIVSLAADRANIGESFCVVLFFAVPAVISWILWRRRAVLPGGFQLVIAGTITLAAIAYKTRIDIWPLNYLVDGDRYLFTLKVLLVWLVAAIASTYGARVRLSLAAATLASFIFSLPHFMFPAYPDLHWRQYSERIERGLKTWVPILPEGFSFTYVGGPPHKG